MTNSLAIRKGEGKILHLSGLVHQAFCLSPHCFAVLLRFAYIEFSDRESVRMAMALDETLFRGRVIKVRVTCECQT